MNRRELFSRLAGAIVGITGLATKTKVATRSGPGVVRLPPGWKFEPTGESLAAKTCRPTMLGEIEKWEPKYATFVSQETVNQLEQLEPYVAPIKIADVTHRRPRPLTTRSFN